MNVLVFQIKTIPDIDSGRKLYDLHDLTDKDVANVMLHKRRQEVGHERLKVHLQKIVSISVAMRTAEHFSVWTLGEKNVDEKGMVEQFFALIDGYTPNLVSWNGKDFDLPVLHYRALLYGLNAKRYWEMGGQVEKFKFNNYLNRYHDRHLGLMDVLAGYESHAHAPLNEMATMLGFPGNLSKPQGDVWDDYLAGKITAINERCETDVINIYLVFLRFEMMRGRLDADEYALECQVVRKSLQAESKPHLTQFDQGWK